MAMARPIPEFAPVTMAFWPCSGLVEVISGSCSRNALGYAAGGAALQAVTERVFALEQNGSPWDNHPTSTEKHRMGFISRAQAAFLSTAERLSFLGPTLARLTLGVVFIGTGWGKLHSLPKVIDFFTELGIPAPGFNAVLASTAEFVCGALLLIGLLSRLATIPLIVTMIVAIITAKSENLHGISDLLGFEEWTYIVLALWILVAGAGPLSLDRVLQNVLRRNPEGTAWAA